MARSAYVLAALLSAAMPGADPVASAALTAGEHDEGFDVALVEDREGRRWEVRAPTTAAAGAALEREAAVLAVLAPLSRGAPVTGPGPVPRELPPLPFSVPGVAASVELDEGGRAVVLPRPPGSPIDLAALGEGPAGRHLAASVGRALAAVHELPASLLEDAGAPVHTAADHRERRLTALDRAAATGLVPSVLLGRWERGLEDVSRWRFSPAVVHGDLGADDVLVAGPAGQPEVAAVVRWGGAQVADPADDLAWLAAAASDQGLAVVREAYAAARSGPRDVHLLERARLASELALADYLLHGVRLGDQDVVDDAHAMLKDLERASTVAGA